jgi:hypothetical protein
MIGRLVAGYVGDRLAGRRQHLQRLGDVDAGGLLNRMLHNLRRNESRLAVHVQREDIPSDEEDPVDVLEAGLAIKNPPKKPTQKTQKTHIKNPLKMFIFCLFLFYFNFS